jgi:hypothetical protein
MPRGLLATAIPAFEEHPVLATVIALVVLIHVAALLYGFVQLWQSGRKRLPPLKKED